MQCLKCSVFWLISFSSLTFARFDCEITISGGVNRLDLYSKLRDLLSILWLSPFCSSISPKRSSLGYFLRFISGWWSVLRFALPCVSVVLLSLTSLVSCVIDNLTRAKTQTSCPSIDLVSWTSWGSLSRFCHSLACESCNSDCWRRYSEESYWIQNMRTSLI